MRPNRPMRDVLADWAPELAKRLGRSEEELLSNGLSAHDFSDGATVEIRSPTGAVFRIPDSFALVREHEELAAVFSEHDGYTEWTLYPEIVIAEIVERFYYLHDPAER